MARTPRTTFRLPPIALLVPALLLVCVIPMAGAGGWWNLTYLVPTLGLVWILVTRTTATPDGVRVSGLLTRRLLPWQRIDRLELDGQRWVVAAERNGRRTRLPMVLTRDLPRLAAASGGAFAFTAPELVAPGTETSPPSTGIDPATASDGEPTPAPPIQQPRA
ncbi:PH domain-containing protein [Nakamurella lactea]|uniref:PH domain-containing protein n=1 Tax=Nakamurella lactea TaxID=459515 RepID=UPI00040CAC09|nr:PH domain-containing protein [Nakamurella lactea]